MNNRINCTNTIETVINELKLSRIATHDNKTTIMLPIKVYDNIENKNYPAVFITSSLYDSQVQYFEPATYTAKLREFNTSNAPILMKMNLIGGHGGMSGKINQFEAIAEDYTVILNLIDYSNKMNICAL